MNTKSVTRLLGFRLNPDNPRQITPQEVSEEIYLELGRPIWRHQKKMQARGKCALSDLHQLWKCDGDCELCEFQRTGRSCQMNLEIADDDGNTCRLIDKLPSNDPSPESIAIDLIILKRLIERLSELCPEAIQAGMCMIDEDLSARKVLEQLNINRSAYRYRIEKAEKQLCNEFGVNDINELFQK